MDPNRPNLETATVTSANLTLSAYEAALTHARDLALNYLGGLRERPVGRGANAAEMASLLDEPLPVKGAVPEVVIEEWFRRAEPGIVASSGPRFFGFVNGGSVPASIGGDWLASAIDQNRGLWLGSPAAAYTELVVVGWLADLFGIPSDWTGTLTSGATMANLVGLGAGRQWVASRLGFDAAADGLGGHPPIPVISSTEIHASARKALATLGLGRNQVRTVPARNGSIDIVAFAEALRDSDGPVLVVANAGEVNGGAFDDLGAMATLCTSHTPGAWLHVDAAFGLFARLDPGSSHLLSGLEHADSVASDCHKWLNVPYDCGMAFVRDRDSLTATFATTAAYLTRNDADAPDLDWRVPEMSQRFRALAVWCALKSLGREGYEEVVQRAVGNAKAFAAWVDEQSDLELLSPATLNIVCFRFAPEGMSEEARDAANRAIVAGIQRGGRAFVTGTSRNGHGAIRAAFDNWMTSRDDVHLLQTAVREAADGIAVG